MAPCNQRVVGTNNRPAPGPQTRSSASALQALQILQQNPRVQNVRLVPSANAKHSTKTVHLDYSVNISGHGNTVVLPPTHGSGVNELVKESEDSEDTNIKINRSITVYGTNNTVVLGAATVVKKQEKPNGTSSLATEDPAAKRKGDVSSFEMIPSLF